ncbi:MAG: hypothetical protein ACLR8U_13935 [Oscillospiraceae bacterium]
MKDRGQKTGTQFLAGLAIGLCYVWLIVDARAASAASVISVRAVRRGDRTVALSVFRVLQFVLRAGFGTAHGAGALVWWSRSSASGLRRGSAFVGLTGGYPSGAQSVGALYGGGSIDRKTAKRLLLFCNNCGPAFIFSVVGPSVFEAALRGFFCISCMLHLPFARHFRPKSGHMQERTAQDAENVPSVSFSSALTASVKKSGQTALEVCMFVVVFGVVTAMVQTALRPVLPDWALVIVSGLLELSGGASALAEAAMPQGVKFALASFFLAFGGLSVHARRRRPCCHPQDWRSPGLFPKLLHALLASILSIPVYALFRAQLEAAQVFLPQAPALLLPAMELMLCAASCLAFRKICG